MLPKESEWKRCDENIVSNHNKKKIIRKQTNRKKNKRKRKNIMTEPENFKDEGKIILRSENVQYEKIKYLGSGSL